MDHILFTCNDAIFMLQQTPNFCIFDFGTYLVSVIMQKEQTEKCMQQIMKLCLHFRLNPILLKKKNEST